MFDPNNKIFKLCAEGMEQEGAGNPVKAKELFENAWYMAKTDLEKSTAAHYLARQQNSIHSKLEWDKVALEHALNLPDEQSVPLLPSLYLNLAKGYEDLKQRDDAEKLYQLAAEFAEKLGSDAYSNMIKKGVQAGLDRLTD